MMKLFRYPVVKLFSYDGSIATGMAYLCCELRGTGADPQKTFSISPVLRHFV